LQNTVALLSGTLRKSAKNLGCIKKAPKNKNLSFLVQAINFECIEGRVVFCGIDSARVNTHNTLVNPAIQHNDNKKKENE
jgi:hypothetical protein